MRTLKRSSKQARTDRGGAGPLRKASTDSTYLERVNLAIDHILANLHEPVRLNAIAKVAMLSPYHFHRVFQAMVGETPSDFSKRLRLERAIGLMAFGKRRSLTEIAFDCGFGSSSDFSRAFRQRYGVPPRAFDVDVWRRTHGEDLRSIAEKEAEKARLAKMPSKENPDGFKVRLRELPERYVAYIRVDDPYQGDAVVRATQRLMAWAERQGFASNQWLGYQWENPEITALSECRYFAAVEVPDKDAFRPKGEIGRHRFPPMLVAQIDIDGGIDLELRALQWIYGVWLPRSRYVPDDQPCFEAWVGKPFAHGMTRFVLGAQLPVRQRLS